jgi:hypothetical protein
MPECRNFAVLTKVYLLNRSPHKSVPNTPYQNWTGKIPNLANLRVFGMSSLIHLPKPNRLKLDPHATEALFVGYSDNMKAWTFWDHRKGTLVTASSVVFGNEIFTLDERHKINIEAVQEWTNNLSSSDSDTDENTMNHQPFTAPSEIKAKSYVRKQVRFQTDIETDRSDIETNHDQSTLINKQSEPRDIPDTDVTEQDPTTLDY